MPLRTIARCLRGIAFRLTSSFATIGLRKVTYRSARVTQFPAEPAPACKSFSTGSRWRSSTAVAPVRARSASACVARAAAVSASLASGPP
jgi:hypothetical protein